jgi:hypothetical protein
MVFEWEVTAGNFETDFLSPLCGGGIETKESEPVDG